MNTGTHLLSGLEDIRLVMRTRFAQRCEQSKKLRQPETPQMCMWISSCSVNLQVSTVSPMSLFLMTLFLMTLFLMTLSLSGTQTAR
jgi:hypothetical protein